MINDIIGSRLSHQFWMAFACALVACLAIAASVEVYLWWRRNRAQAPIRVPMAHIPDPPSGGSAVQRPVQPPKETAMALSADDNNALKSVQSLIDLKNGETARADAAEKALAEERAAHAQDNDLNAKALATAHADHAELLGKLNALVAPAVPQPLPITSADSITAPENDTIIQA